MPSFRVIEHLDIVEYFRFCIFSGYKYFFPDTFMFQSFKEAFHDSIIITVSSSAHTGNDVGVFEHTLPFIGAKL